jgi:hypothetical protein
MTFARALLLVLAGCLIWTVLDQARLVSPTPENESVFLKTYTPNNVIDKFKAAAFTQVSTGTSAGANRGFASHEEDFEPTLVINSGDWVALLQALRDDITSSLTAEGGKILEASGNQVSGFQIKYALGKSRGTVAVEPIKIVPASNLASAGSGRDKITVNFRISIDEKWFKASPLALQYQ